MKVLPEEVGAETRALSRLSTMSNRWRCQPSGLKCPWVRGSYLPVGRGRRGPMAFSWNDVNKTLRSTSGATFWSLHLSSFAMRFARSGNPTRWAVATKSAASSAELSLTDTAFVAEEAPLRPFPFVTVTVVSAAGAVGSSSASRTTMTSHSSLSSNTDAAHSSARTVATEFLSFRQAVTYVSQNGIVTSCNRHCRAYHCVPRSRPRMFNPSILSSCAWARFLSAESLFLLPFFGPPAGAFTRARIVSTDVKIVSTS
mmetsp:Transcript_30226/g.84459  ORF Transcript_30226/g.84459 Transcript_30226/m.84459 type:complete len:256 (-) Transcript_30226:1685-2452(-)